MLEGETENPPIERVFPDGCIELIFHTGLPFSKLVDGVAIQQAHSIVVGQLIRALFLQPSKKISVIGVRFKPHGLAAFSNIPAHLFTETELTIYELWGREGLDLEEQVQLAKGPSAIMLIQDFLVAHLGFGSPVRFDIAGLVTSMTANSGAGVNYFAGLANLSERQFTRNFKDMVGVSPKEFLKISRFNQVLKLLETQENTNFSAVAQQCGYYDQAHFIKDFREFTGTTPGGFAQDNKLLIPIV